MSVQAVNKPPEFALPKPLVSIVIDYYGPLQTEEVVHVTEESGGFTTRVRVGFVFERIAIDFELLEWSALEAPETDTRLSKFAFTLFEYDLGDRGPYDSGGTGIQKLNLCDQVCREVNRMNYDPIYHISQNVAKIYELLTRLKFISQIEENVEPAQEMDSLPVVKLNADQVFYIERGVDYKPRKKPAPRPAV